MKATHTFALLGALALSGCTADYAQNGDSQVVLLMTGINSGDPLESDVRPACPDFVPLRLENHFKNPSVTNTGFRHDFTIERYEVHYFRSDGRNAEGVDVPYSITGNLAHEVREESDETLNLEVVRAQAKLDPPLTNLARTGTVKDTIGTPAIVTMFAEITLHARTTTGVVTNPVSARLQIDFSDFGSFATDTASCVAP